MLQHGHCPLARKAAPFSDSTLAAYLPPMKPRIDSSSAEASVASPAETKEPSVQDDPELESELRELAQWLLDVYLWRLEEDRKCCGGNGQIDKHPPPATI